MALGEGRTGGLQGQRERRRPRGARRHTERERGRAAPGIESVVNGRLLTEDTSWRDRGQERPEQRDWDKERVRNRDPEEGKRPSWGWQRLCSHTEAIEKS